MFLTFLSLLTYRKITSVATSNSVVVLDSFGFEANGTISISISSPIRSVCYALLTKSQLRQLKTANPSFKTETTCHYFSNNSNYYHVFETNSKESYEETIKLKDVYYPCVSTFSMHPTQHKSIKASEYLIVAKVTEVYRNPASYLDYRWYSIIDGSIGYAIIMFVLVVLWIVNWVCHFSIQISLHYCISAVFFSSLLNLTLRIFLYADLNTHDTSPVLLVFSTLASVLSYVMLYAAILLIAKGWCIVRDSLSVKDFFLCFLYSSFLLFYQVSYEATDNSPSSVLLSILGLVSIVLYFYEFLKSMRISTYMIMGHLLSVANAGFDIKTTPIYQKKNMYSAFGIIVDALLLIISIYCIVILFVDVTYAVNQLVIDGIRTAFLISLAIVFRLRGDKKTNYSFIPAFRKKNRKEGGNTYESFQDENIESVNLDVEEQETQADDEILLEDLQSMNMNSPAFTRGGRTWTEDQPLPPPPIIIDGKQAKSSTLQHSLTRPRNTLTESQVSQQRPQTTVIISSPGGTDSAQAIVIDEGKKPQEI